LKHRPNLCKAGEKQFKAWNRLEKTKAFLRVLSNAVLMWTALLIKYKTGHGSEQATWVHPQVAINIAYLQRKESPYSGFECRYRNSGIGK
jgi:hypothetical protein